MSARIQIEVITAEYQFSHGKLPRGYGSWAFYFGKDRSCSDTSPPVFYPASTYAAARKLAIADARKAGLPIVVVGS